MSVDTTEHIEEEAMSNEGGTPWHGVLAPEGVVSGDNRKFGVGALTWRDLPLPLSWQKSSAPGHDGSVVVGRIDSIERDQNNLLQATGVMNDTPEAQEAKALLKSKSIRGVSVDVDAVEAGYEDGQGNTLTAENMDAADKVVMVANKGRVAGATLCPIPAFAEAFVALDDEFAGPVPPGLVPKGKAPEAGAPPKEEKPVDTQESLDKEAEDLLADDSLDEQTLVEKATDLLDRYREIEATPPDDLVKAAGLTTEVIDAHLEEHLQQAFLEAEAVVQEFETVSEENWDGGAQFFTPEQWQRSTLIHLKPGAGQSPDTKGLHKLPVRNPSGTLVRRAILSAASILAGARGGVKAPDDQKVLAAQEVVRLYRNELGEQPPKSVLRLSGESGVDVDAPGASSLIAAARTLPRADVFADPEFAPGDGRLVQNKYGLACPLTIEGDHIFGHLAQWKVCHTTFSDACTIAPHSLTDYAYFRLGGAEVADGPIVPVGQITMGTGHAPNGHRVRPALEHYDNTGFAVADVAMGEDTYGIWYSGLLRPEVTDEQRRELLAAKLSGDWRLVAGNLELVAALAVNVPGFPVPRIATAIKSGRQTALVAAGILPDADPVEQTLGQWGPALGKWLREDHARRAKAARLAATLGRDKKTRAAEAAALIRQGN